MVCWHNHHAHISFSQAPFLVLRQLHFCQSQLYLTCAHAARYASQVEVQANQEQARLAAKVEATALDMDLAVLKLDNAGFLVTHPTLAR